MAAMEDVNGDTFEAPAGYVLKSGERMRVPTHMMDGKSGGSNFKDGNSPDALAQLGEMLINPAAFVNVSAAIVPVIGVIGRRRR